MDVVDARRNLERYQNNVSALQQVHPQDLTVDELNTITVLIKKQNHLIANIQDALVSVAYIKTSQHVNGCLKPRPVLLLKILSWYSLMYLH